MFAAMEPERVEEVKEEIEYYIESNEEMEGMEDLDPYEVRIPRRMATSVDVMFPRQNDCPDHILFYVR